MGVGSIGTADGSALVRLGDTTVVCGVKAEIALPELDEPNQGFLGELDFDVRELRLRDMFCSCLYGLLQS